MSVLVVVVGSVRGVYAAAVQEYERRARRYWKLRIIEVHAGAAKGSSRATPEQVRRAEGERILAAVPRDLELVALTRYGELWTSRDLAGHLGELALRSRPGAVFVLGGAFGLSDEVLNRAARRVSLSRMTLPHEMARLVLAEQLYRAGTILSGEPYHKESRDP